MQGLWHIPGTALVPHLQDPRPPPSQGHVAFAQLRPVRELTVPAVPPGQAQGTSAASVSVATSPVLALLNNL